MKPFLLIKDFGNNTECDSVEKLTRSLSKYIGKHVSIVKKLPSEINKTFFVFVNDDKSLTNTYTNENLDFSVFN